MLPPGSQLSTLKRFMTGSASMFPRLLLGVPALVACSATVAPQDATGTSVAAVIVVEQATGPGEASHSESVARFLRTRGPLDDAARGMVGAALELPPPGQCAPIADVSASG